RRVGALVRGAAGEDIGLAVGAGDRLARRNAGGERGILVALEGQRDGNDRIGRRGQGRAGAGGRERRRRRRAELQGGVAAEDRHLLLQHHLLQQATGHSSLDFL